MTVYSRPGVYFEWEDAAPGIQPVRTDVAGFVGIAERGPLHKAVKVESWNQFTSLFGGCIAQGYLAYAVRAFFANGGRTCYVVRAADPMRAHPAYLDIYDPRTNKCLLLTASSEGTWAHDMRISVLRTDKTHLSFTFALLSGQQEVWRDLTLIDDDTDPRHVVRVLSPERANALYAEQPPIGTESITIGSQLVDARLIIGPVPGHPVLRLTKSMNRGQMSGGADGIATLRPEHLNSALGASNEIWGLAALSEVPEVAIVAIPDLRPSTTPPPLPSPDCCDLTPENILEPRRPSTTEMPPLFSDDEVQALEDSLVGHCETRVFKDRMALLQPPSELRNPLEVIDWYKRIDSSYAAAYFPWLLVPDPMAGEGDLRAVPPCGHVAGIYAQVENDKGVHKAPANESMEDTQDVAVNVDDTVHGLLNVSAINVLRTSSAWGLRVMGARTRSSDPLWRYVNVRRLLLMIERGINADAQWLPFEPNNFELWREIDRVLRTFLDDLYRRGMLDGNSADEAYSVDCSPTTNPPSVTDQGQLIAVIGVLPPRPAEYVIVRIGRTDGELQFTEGR